MHDVLALTASEEIMHQKFIMIFIGVVVSILTYFVRRELIKVDKHTSNTKLHLDPENGYVKRSLCDVRCENIEKSLYEFKQDVKTTIHNLYELHQKTSDEQKELLEKILEK